MLDQVFYGNTLKQWIISLLIIVIALVLNKLIVIFNRRIISKLTGKTQSNLDDILSQTLEKPIRFGIILIGIWIAAMNLNMSDKVREIIGKSYQILIVLNVTWLIANLINALVEEIAVSKKNRDNHFDTKLLPLLKRGILILVWIIGIVTALNNIGIKVTTLLGTLGIGGVAVALAAQDTVKNIFGGITIFTDHPFRIGDTIQYDSYEGTVVDIGLRSTRIKTYDGRIVTVANYKIMDASVTNISEEPSRRVVLKLGVTYDTTPEKMREAITILKGIPSKVSELEDKTVATFDQFADSALIINYTYYIRKGSDIQETNSTVNFEILTSFNNAGLNFAFPSQTMYIESGDAKNILGGNKENNSSNNNDNKMQ